jgi:hypothetical protein
MYHWTRTKGSICIANMEGTVVFNKNSTPFFEQLAKAVESGDAGHNIGEFTSEYYHTIMENRAQELQTHPDLYRFVSEFAGSSTPLLRNAVLNFLHNLLENPLVVEKLESDAGTEEIFGGFRQYIGSLDIVRGVFNKKVAITFDGQVVLYNRASWVRPDGSLDNWAHEDVPLVPIQGSCKQLVGTLDYVNGLCSDQGRINAIMVNPAHLHQSGCGSGNLFKTNEYTPLGPLEEGDNPETGVRLIYTQYCDAGPLRVNLPLTQDNWNSYLYSLRDAGVEADALQVETVPMVSASC